ncbi:MAG: YifB family Mg chelatase-like AAA ATPase [Pseudomonadales bacterium]|nr:YifB family Mg chelatase-like AAA ATPase [Pseudomonadales bacterium]
MSLAIVYSRAAVGMHAPLVTVEVHLSNGLPGFSIVGLPDTAVKESKERVRSALLNSMFEFPAKRITVNLAPADLPKDGGRFDLAIALGILAASEQIPLDALTHQEFIGELALSGTLRPTRGCLTAALAAREAGNALWVPEDNKHEAALPSNSCIYPASHLLQVCRHLSKDTQHPAIHPFRLDAERFDTEKAQSDLPDMADVKGQHLAKRALEVAAAGKHNLLMIGPPGAGKSMLAARLPSLLPELTETERLDIAAIYSVANSQSSVSWHSRPFRSPHHSASSTAIAGGGSNPKPGEISLAHQGILFLDELPEFNRKALEILREPLETGEIAISRAQSQATYPANFQLVAAMNPCPCGKPENPPEGCNNPTHCCHKYQSKLSGPLLDRIDIHLRVDALPLSLLSQKSATPGESSECIRTRVVRARATQLKRAKKPNHDLSAKEVEHYCALNEKDQQFIARAAEKLELSARAFHRVLKVARTLADLDATVNIETKHLSEALSYRAIF